MKFKKRVRERQHREGISYSEALRREESSMQIEKQTPPKRKIPEGIEPTLSRAPAVGRSANPMRASEMAQAASGWIAKALGVEAGGSSPDKRARRGGRR